MTPKEFKAWFEGFTEAFSGMPTKAQWLRIKERVAEIDGQPITERVFVDRYWPSWPIYSPAPLYSPPARWVMTNIAADGVSSNNTQWSGTTAMYALGQADAQAMVTQ